MNAPFARPETKPGTPLTFRSSAEPVRYSVECAPAREAGGLVRNWSLTQLSDYAYLSRLRDALPDGECRYYAPSVYQMSGAVARHVSFTDIYELDRFRSIRRPGYREGLNTRIPCDGTWVGSKEGFVMTAGGCPLLVLSGTGECGRCLCIVAHAGRDSLIDLFRVGKAIRPRAHESVVESMVAYARQYFSAKPKELILRSFFSLPWQAFPHDQRDTSHGAANKKLQEYLLECGLERALIENTDGEICLSLNVLVQLLAEQQGIGCIETGHHDLPEDGDFAYTRHALPELGGVVRNLVMLRRL